MHRRLGYISYKRIKQLLNSNSVGLIKLKDKRKLLYSKKLYELCLAGKMKESFNKKTNKCEGKRVKRLYTDLSRYYLASIQGFRYFLVVLCDASRIIWVKLLKTKSIDKVYLALNKIKKRAKQLTGEKCAYFRANNSTSEFGYTFQELLVVNRIQFEPSPAFKHSLNSVIKRAIGIIAIIIRSIIYEARLLY